MYLLLAGYYVLRYRTRHHVQSLFIAGLMVAWPFAASLLVGLPSRAVGLAFAGAGAAYGTIFLVVVVDELRRQRGKGKAL